MFSFLRSGKLRVFFKSISLLLTFALKREYLSKQHYITLFSLRVIIEKIKTQASPPMKLKRTKLEKNIAIPTKETLGV